MTDLQKIAQDTEKTYLEKVAAIVDAYAAGEVTGEEADAIASEAGIAAKDLLALHNAIYGQPEEGMEKTASENTEVEGDLEKVASEAADFLVKVASDENSTYLEKCAAVADAYAAGAISAEEGDTLAEEIGVSPEDVASVFMAAYGEPGDMEKTAAAEEAIGFLQKVASEGTYLEKCAGVADAYMSGALSQEEAAEVASELGLDLNDVDSVIAAAYGEELEKEAGVKEQAAKAGEKILEGLKSAKDGVASAAKSVAGGAKKYSGYDDIREAIKKTKSMKEFTDAGKETASFANLAKQRNKAAAVGAGKAAGTVALVGGAGYGASKLFGSKKDQK